MSDVALTATQHGDRPAADRTGAVLRAGAGRHRLRRHGVARRSSGGGHLGERCALRPGDGVGHVGSGGGAPFRSRVSPRASDGVRALTLGNLFALVGIAVVILAASVRVFPLLLAGILMIGAGIPRATCSPGSRPRIWQHLSIAAVISRSSSGRTTIGGVAGPLLLGPGEIVGQAVGMPPQTGSYLFSFVAQCAALVLYLVALHPDPLLAAQRLAKVAAATTGAVVLDRLV